jgi:uncharacterized protein (DUF302 family)
VIKQQLAVRDRETDMFAQVLRFKPIGLRDFIASRAPAAAPSRAADGLVKVKSAYSLEETVDRLKKAIAAKGIPLFGAVDQTRLAAGAGVKLHPSVLLVFGAPSLAAQFLTSNPYAGLDWPIRLLVLQDSTGAVWIAYTDFAWIARRRGIADLPDQTALATAVVDSIASTVRARSSWWPDAIIRGLPIRD